MASSSDDDPADDLTSGHKENEQNTGQKFSKEVLAVLEQLYVGGMTGWGNDHCRDIELAIVNTGLSLSQVKVRSYVYLK